jgi:hypothetical protein
MDFKTGNPYFNFIYMFQKCIETEINSAKPMKVEKDFSSWNEAKSASGLHEKSFMFFFIAI